MKSVLSFILTAVFPALISATCTIEGKTTITFYGFPDNSPPGPATAHNCDKRNFTASTGDGSFKNPGTMATASGEFEVCEIIYVPYLKKYVRSVAPSLAFIFGSKRDSMCYLGWNQ